MNTLQAELETILDISELEDSPALRHEIVSQFLATIAAKLPKEKKESDVEEAVAYNAALAQVKTALGINHGI